MIGWCGLTPEQADASPQCRNGACARMNPGLCLPCSDRVAGWVAVLPQLVAALTDRTAPPCCADHAPAPTRPAFGARLARAGAPYEPTHPNPLPAHLTPAAANGPRVSGTSAPGLPGGVAVLSWLGPAAGDDRRPDPLTGLDPGDDLAGPMQHGPEPLLSHLAAWVAEARETLGRTRPDHTIPALLAFLRHNHERICEQPWADAYAQEIHQMWCTANTLAGTWDPRPERAVGVPCPFCDAMALFRHPGQDGRTCEADEGGCGRWLPDEQYDRWVRLSAHFAKETG